MGGRGGGRQEVSRQGQVEKKLGYRKKRFRPPRKDNVGKAERCRRFNVQARSFQIAILDGLFHGEVRKSRRSKENELGRKDGP